MYCPKCGSNNQDEIKFCTRCGMNLAVVADAVNGKSAGQSPLDERMVNLFKDYYRGRNGLIIGGAICALVAITVILAGAFHFAEKGDLLSTLAGFLLVYGIIILIWGAAKWNESASEIKALERAAAKGVSLPTAEPRRALSANEPASIRVDALSTDPIEMPASVTEQTTRALDERAYHYPVENQPE
jgi:hypothetical protein